VILRQVIAAPAFPRGETFALGKFGRTNSPDPIGDSIPPALGAVFDSSNAAPFIATSRSDGRMIAGSDPRTSKRGFF
jgi:hypothetical protein